MKQICSHIERPMFGLLLLFIETKELCEARAFETAIGQSDLFTFKCGQ